LQLVSQWHERLEDIESAWFRLISGGTGLGREVQFGAYNEQGNRCRRILKRPPGAGFRAISLGG